MHCELSAKWYQHCDMELDLYIVSCPHQNYKTPSQKKIKNPQVLWTEAALTPQSGGGTHALIHFYHQ